MSDLGPAGDGEPARGQPVDRPPRAAAAGHVVGRAAGSTTRVEAVGGDTTLTFGLLGPDGQRAREVELRGSRIFGTVHDGDWVEVGDHDGSRRLEVTSVFNLTAGAEVRVAGRATTTGAGLVKAGLLVVLVLALLLVVWVVLGMVGVVPGGWPFGHGLPGDDGRLDPGSAAGRLPAVS